jgi:hypothetical protein
MGMGYQGEMALVLDKEKVEALVAEPYAAFLSALDKHERNFNGFARAYSITDSIELENLGADEQLVLDEMLHSFSAVSAAFKSKTGLSLYVDYHNSQEEGDEPDDVDGGFYCLDFNEVYNMRQKARALHKKAPIEMAFCVTNTAGSKDDKRNSMKTGYEARFALPMPNQEIEEVVGEVFAKLLSKLAEYEMSFEDFARAADEELQEFEFPNAAAGINKELATAEIVDLNTEVMELFDKLTGLSLFIGYHDPEFGGRLDTLTGGFYSLYFSDVYEMTDGAKALEKVVPFGRKYFVVKA